MCMFWGCHLLKGLPQPEGSNMVQHNKAYKPSKYRAYPANAPLNSAPPSKGRPPNHGGISSTSQKWKTQGEDLVVLVPLFCFYMFLYVYPRKSVANCPDMRTYNYLHYTSTYIVYIYMCVCVYQLYIYIYYIRIRIYIYTVYIIYTYIYISHLI